jgi:beta-glucosidase
VDNFEWERGWSHRFGLYAEDPETQVRTARPSARFYAEIARASALSSAMVGEYAPTLMETLFPG